MELKEKVSFFMIWVVFMASALGVVYMTHEARLSTQELELLKNEATDLRVKAGQLLLERSSLSAFVRVERLAASQLDMLIPQIEHMVLVKP